MSDDKDLKARAQDLFAETYRLGRVLGRGAMSIVFSARRTADNEPVAIKIQRYTDPEGQRRLLRDIQRRVEVCSQIRHPNVVAIHEIHSDLSGEAMLALVLERTGSSLPNWLTEHSAAATIGRLLEFFRHVGAGIDEIHRHRIVHCDIKPTNILLSMDHETAKIGDFSISLTEEESGRQALEDVWGTPAFVAPEQILATTFGPRADIYAFGMTIYVLLCGSYAFEAKTPRELLFAQLSGEPVPLRRRNRTWPAALDTALMRALAKEPDRRQATASELAAEVASALASHTPLRLTSFSEGDLSRFSSGEVRVKGLF